MRRPPARKRKLVSGPLNSNHQINPSLCSKLKRSTCSAVSASLQPRTPSWDPAWRSTEPSTTLERTRTGNQLVFQHTCFQARPRLPCFQLQFQCSVGGPADTRSCPVGGPAHVPVQSGPRQLRPGRPNNLQAPSILSLVRPSPTPSVLSLVRPTPAPQCPVVGPAHSNPPVSCRWSGPLQPPSVLSLVRPTPTPSVLSLVRPSPAPQCPVVGPTHPTTPVSCRWSGPLQPPSVLSLVRPTPTPQCPVVGPAHSNPPSVLSLCLHNTLEETSEQNGGSLRALRAAVCLISNIHAKELIVIQKENDSFTFELPEEASSCLISRSVGEEKLVLWNTLTSGPRTPQYLKT
ncbi:hypothetical protein F7725_004090 [Dissostichus mawsoni]|uniref:Uncharacterized protein n=1 Tax=Dissostichus mawsoni TaxID=36200 RepID=A0A7J5YC21_DISMA|nr:hypothetical protein F7725_004090 [Dissostichus mawsoni]